MKVLFISSWYPNSANPLKGIFVKKHVEAIHHVGNQIEVVALTVSPSVKLFEKKVYKFTDDKGILTHQIEINSRFYKWIHIALFYQSRLLNRYVKKNIIKRFKPDVIHSNVLYPAGLLGFRLSQQLNVPHIITEHWSKVDKFMSKSFYASLGKKAYNSAKVVTAVSNFLKESLSKHFLNPEKVRVIPNVVNTDLFSYKKKKIRPSELYFVCVAHWTSPKRPDLIFNSLNEIAKKTEINLVLNVVGNGYLMSELKQQSWNFKVNYLGNQNPAQLAAIIQDSDCFLHASDIETFSIVIAEALSTGTPVIASDVGAIPELVGNENGLVCKNDLTSWVEGLLAFIQRTYRFDTKKMSENCHKYNLAQIGKEFTALYKELI